MKPCPYEQNVLLALHGALPLRARLATALHALRCPQCRARQAEFRKISDTLVGLRPAGYSATAFRGSSSSLRLALLAAAVALAAAAFSYYVATQGLVVRAAETGPSAVSGQRCDDPPANAAKKGRSKGIRMKVA